MLWSNLAANFVGGTPNRTMPVMIFMMIMVIVVKLLVMEESARSVVGSWGWVVVVMMVVVERRSLPLQLWWWDGNDDNADDDIMEWWRGQRWWRWWRRWRWNTLQQSLMRNLPTLWSASCISHQHPYSIIIAPPHSSPTPLSQSQPSKPSSSYDHHHLRQRSSNVVLTWIALESYRTCDGYSWDAFSHSHC